MDTKLQKMYYTPRGYWKGLTAIKNLAMAVKISESNDKECLPSSRHILSSKFDVSAPNEVHLDLHYLPPWPGEADRVAEPLTANKAKEVAVAFKIFYKYFFAGLSCFRLILGMSSWVEHRSCRPNTGLKSGMVARRPTETKTFFNASTMLWPNSCKNTNMCRRYGSQRARGQWNGWHDFLQLLLWIMRWLVFSDAETCKDSDTKPLLCCSWSLCWTRGAKASLGCRHLLCLPTWQATAAGWLIQCALSRCIS